MEERARMVLALWTLTGLVVMLASLSIFTCWQLNRCQRQLPPDRPLAADERPGSDYPGLPSGES